MDISLRTWLNPISQIFFLFNSIGQITSLSDVSEFSYDFHCAPVETRKYHLKKKIIIRWSEYFIIVLNSKNKSNLRIFMWHFNLFVNIICKFDTNAYCCHSTVKLADPVRYNTRNSVLWHMLFMMQKSKEGTINWIIQK